MKQKIPLFKMHGDESDIESVTSILKSGANWAEGSIIKKFEKSICDYIDSQYSVVFNSGTSALFAALLATNIGSGDEVVVPSFSFISTANAPFLASAKPVFADIERIFLGLDIQDVENKTTGRTKAIIPMHYGGCPCAIRELSAIAKENDLIVIEDAAEAFGAMIGSKFVGTFGDMGMFSFCQNKIISTGEGGAIVTNSHVLYNKLKLIRSHGRRDDGEYISGGFNFRMPSMNAALGLSQMKNVGKNIKRRREIASMYADGLDDINDIHMCGNKNINHFNVYQMFSILTKRRNQLSEYLTRNGIGNKVYFEPIHKTHFYKNLLQYDIRLPVTERISSLILSLPMYPDLKNDEIEYIIKTIRDFYAKERIF